MVNLKQIKQTLEYLNIEGVPVGNVDNAIRLLEELNLALNGVPVMGRERIDQLLGCMMGIEQVIGNEEPARGGRLNR